MSARTEAEIRAYTQTDRDAFRNLAREMHELAAATSANTQSATFDEYFDHLLKIQSELKGAILVACADSELVGFVCVLGVADAQDSAEGCYSFLSDLYVRPTHRRLGIGGLLTAAAEYCARTLGASTIALRVAVSNTPALGFYRARHYRKQFLVMSKKL